MQKIFRGAYGGVRHIVCVYNLIFINTTIGSILQFLVEIKGYRVENLLTQWRKPRAARQTAVQD